MANEIKVLEGDKNGRYRVLFLYPVATPATYTDGAGQEQTIVPTPAPTEGMEASVLSAGEASALDSGDGAWEVVSYGPDPAATNPQNIAALQALYAKRKAAFDTIYQARYKYAGLEVDAP